MAAKKQTAKRSAKAAPAVKKMAGNASPKAMYETNSLWREVGFLFLIAAALLTLFSLFGSGLGAAGDVLRALLFGLFGMGAYALPVFVLLYSIWLLAVQQPEHTLVRLGAMIGFMLCLSALAAIWHTVVVGAELPIWGRLTIWFRQGSVANGGALGGLVGAMLVAAFDRGGSIFLLFVLLLAFFVLGTGTSFFQAIARLILFGREQQEVRKRRRLEEAEEEEDWEEEEPEDNPLPPKKKTAQKTAAQDKPKMNVSPGKAFKKAYDIQLSTKESEEQAQAPQVEITHFVKRKKRLVVQKKAPIFDYAAEAMRQGAETVVDEVGQVPDFIDEAPLFLPEDMPIIHTKEDNPPGFQIQAETEGSTTVGEENRHTIEAAKPEELFLQEESKASLQEAVNPLLDEEPLIFDAGERIESAASNEEEWQEKEAAVHQAASEAEANLTIEEPAAEIPVQEPERPAPFSEPEMPQKAPEPEAPPEPEEVPYVFPPVSLLKQDTFSQGKGSKEEMLRTARKLEETLKSFGVVARVVQINKGPAITRYELSPNQGVKVSKIVNLADDIALNLAASGIRIEAPVPGKSVVGIEVPNKEAQSVFLRTVLDTEAFFTFPSKLAFAVGEDIAGSPVIADVAKMPHLLIAGATGSGKSVCINTLITSIIYKADPKEVKLLLVDPKVVELSVYNGIPHLLIPVVTDPKKASSALNWAVREMLSRYQSFAEHNVRDIKGFNAAKRELGEMEAVMPQIVIVIDELSDLMMAAPGEVEDAICRLAQMARAAGMHLIIATQRPSVDVITGLIKANIPSRLAFAVSSGIDSRTILDMVGAEKLLGKGDMLFYPSGISKPVRLQGAFISDKEVEQVVSFVKKGSETVYDDAMIEQITVAAKQEAEAEEADEFYDQAVEHVVMKEKASVSMLQRQFRIGYNRAARLMEELERQGIVGPEDGSKPRKVLLTRQGLYAMRNPAEEAEQG